MLQFNISGAQIVSRMVTSRSSIALPKKRIADYMSKPLQGKLFHTFINVIMGWEHVSTLFDAFNSSEERVGNNDNLKAVPKSIKLTYVEIAKASLAVDKQNILIANGIDPLDQLKIKQ